MTAVERIIEFDCSGEPLIGMLSEPEATCKVGVLVIVGGPQYRVGSHRQFVLLARRLAAEGVPAMRFDYRGMGDSPGPARSFEAISADIARAIDAMLATCRGVEKVVLWGLCDAASAALSYCQECSDTRVAGIVLLNPWVRSIATGARTRVKYYYARRVFDRAFWRRLLQGNVRVVDAVAGLLRSVAEASAGNETAVVREKPQAFQDRMAEGLRGFAGPVLLLISGRDLTAKEFLDYADTNPRWAGLLARPNVLRHDLADANHTFSSARLRAEVESRTLAWLRDSVLPRAG